ncbi:jg1838 [Pararge aegeria aegeria]|uniref:Jg1838 protein n=1 Tax=Pararge aegeria aegeria TaxID=348720 RepID=A0A8S4QVB3_9NEOP|nr:jg1838 [Pararge aegeria aegeria]
MVSDEPSMSDHRHINFDIKSCSSMETVTYRNPRCTSWDSFQNNLESNLELVPKSIKTRVDLDLAVDAVSRGTISAFEDSCPLRVKTTRRKAPWWNSRLKRLRDKTRKLFNRAKATREWDIYKKSPN